MACPDFFMKQDRLPPYFVLTLGIGDVLRCLDWDTRTIVGWSCSDAWDGTLSWYPLECANGT